MRKKIVVWYHRITNFFYYLKTFLTSSVLLKYENHISAVNFHNFFFKEWMFKPRLYWIFLHIDPSYFASDRSLLFFYFCPQYIMNDMPHLSSCLILKLFEMQNYTGQCAFKIFKQKIDFIKFDFSECEVFSKKWSIVI